MSTPYFIKNRHKGRQIGNTFWRGRKEFGFVPLNENLLDSRILQPGDSGYGLCMFEYYDSILKPETPIVDIYGFKKDWSNFKEWLFNSGKVELSDMFVGNIRLWSDEGQINTIKGKER